MPTPHSLSSCLIALTRAFNRILNRVVRLDFPVLEILENFLFSPSALSILLALRCFQMHFIRFGGISYSPSLPRVLLGMDIKYCQMLFLKILICLYLQTKQMCIYVNVLI